MTTARIRVQIASNRLLGKLIEVASDDTPPDVQLKAIQNAWTALALSRQRKLYSRKAKLSRMSKCLTP